ncbi:MAG: Rieske (2Fe-2S) protein [Actinobacteria bacterium]|nr:Rieske (2Fe-2S) protein [Actinomycetota bacterium]
MTRVTRRNVILAAGASVGLAACGSAEEIDRNTASTAVPERSVQLARVADVPVGGGVLIAARELAITQPVEGEFHAFGALCTHQNCPVSQFERDEIRCPCHGSTFDSRTGEVISGPASLPLHPVAIRVDGDRIYSDV